MEVEEINWAALKASVTYNPSDSVAVIRTSENALSWQPVYLNEATGQAFINQDGRWQHAESVRGFLKFEKVRTKKYFDTATLQLI